MSPFPPPARPFRGTRPAVSGRLLVGLAALAVGALLPGTAAAAPEPGVLVVEGRGGTTTTVTVREQVQVRDPQPTELAGGGEYAAVLVEPVDRPAGSSRLGAVQVRAFRDGTRDSVALLGADGVLEPGQYRVTLLGAGPVRVRWELDSPDSPGLRVEPRTRVPVRFLGRSELLTAGLSQARIDLPGEAPAGRRVIQVGLTDGLAADDYRMCATTEADCPATPVPVCPPSPVPCGDAALVQPRVGTQAAISALLHPAVPQVRALRWSADGYHDTEQLLRGAAIVF